MSLTIGIFHTVFTLEVEDVHGQSHIHKEGVVLDMFAEATVVVVSDVVRSMAMCISTLEEFLKQVAQP